VKRDKYSREWSYRIQDILTSIDNVERYTDSMTLAEFRKNQMAVDAVIRNFEIIGEASNHIPKSIKLSYPDIMWIEMYGMRNVLVHEYFGVDLDTVWYTIKNHFPILKAQLNNIKWKTEP